MTKKEYAETKNAEARAKLDGLVERLSDPQFVATAMQERRFSVRPDAPSRSWSMLNQMFMLAEDTFDARGFRQWQKVGRSVKKGAHAFQILAPMVKKVTEYDEEKGCDVTRTRIGGFKLVNVFRYEDTEGEPIEGYGSQLDVDELPLIDVARSLGVDVSYAPTTLPALGLYNPAANTIKLCSDGEQTFFHELSHAIDRHLGNLARADSRHPEIEAHNEIVAELSACFLASLYGKQVDLGGTKTYVAMYAEQKKEHPAQALAAALDRVDAIYQYVAEHVAAPALAGA